MLLIQFILVLIVASFSYVIGAGIGRISKDEIKKDKKTFVQVDLFIWTFLMMAVVIFGLIAEKYAILGIIAAAFVMILAKKKVHHITVIPLVLGFASAFDEVLFIIIITTATMYLILYGATQWYRVKKPWKEIFSRQAIFILLGLIAVGLTVLMRDVGTNPAAILATFLASLVLVGQYARKIVL